MSFVTAEQVISYTGVKPSDLGFADEMELDAWVDDRLPEVEDLINTYVFGLDAYEIWDDETVPQGVRRIALDLARNMVMTMIVARETPIVSLGDMKARVLEPDIFTTSIKGALDVYKVKASRPSWSTTVRMFRVRREDEMPESV